MVIKMITIYIGYLLDMIFGDPYELPHPIRLIGRIIETIEGFFRKYKPTALGLRIAGVITVILTVSISFLVPYLILKLALKIHLFVFIVVESIMIFQILATCTLGKEAEKISETLRNKRLDSARKQISYLVSRDTNAMTEEDICKATIETVSENFADGVIAPMLFIFLGGAPLGWAYKAVNTLDSMIGYKNEKYINFGRAAAIFDDIVNWIPARISVIFIWVASLLMKLDVKNSVKIVKRDHDKHSSPNSAWPESAFAGALRIQLGGKATYFGKTEEKPTMGEPIEKVNYTYIKKSVKLMYVASFMGLLIFTGLRVLFMKWA